MLSLGAPLWATLFMRAMSNSEGHGQWATLLTKSSFVAHCPQLLYIFKTENLSSPRFYFEKLVGKNSE